MCSVNLRTWLSLTGHECPLSWWVHGTPSSVATIKCHVVLGSFWGSLENLGVRTTEFLSLRVLLEAFSLNLGLRRLVQWVTWVAANLGWIPGISYSLLSTEPGVSPECGQV